MEADTLAGREARDQEAACAPEASELAVGADERHSARDAIAGLEVAGDGAATVADGDLEAREAASAHRGCVGLLVDRRVAICWTNAGAVVVITLSNRKPPPARLGISPLMPLERNNKRSIGAGTGLKMLSTS